METPDEAIDCFIQTELDALAINGSLIWKGEADWVSQVLGNMTPVRIREDADADGP